MEATATDLKKEYDEKGYVIARKAIDPDLAPYYLAFPKRYIPTRKFFTDWEHDGLSDVLFLASRDSFYSVQNYRTPKVHIQRFTLREDGFVSARAPKN